MKAIRADLSADLTAIEIHTFSDWHVGDKASDLQLIKEEIETVKNTPNAFVICNGDLMNNATKTSVSDCYSEELPPMQQIEKLCDLLSPIKDKILLITQGNHEARTYRNDGIDLTSMVAMKLGLEDKYSREGAVLYVRFGVGIGSSVNTPRKTCYTLYVTHGSGGGRKEGAKAIRLADMASIVDTDIYIHSHTHLPMVMKQSFYRLLEQKSSLTIVEKLFVNTAAALDYGGYGQTYEFKPASKSNPVIFLNGRKKQMVARL